MAKLRKSYSNYTLRKKRQVTTKGSIYERDWMTVSEMDGFAPGTIPVYASGNFKMVVNGDRNGKKKYSFSNWVLNDKGSEEWTLKLIKEEELKITSDLIKPNYTSILDFAYYGSAAEIVKGSVNGIITWYPGEIYTTTRTLSYFDSIYDTYVEITGATENPFMIDVNSPYVDKNKVVNPLRYMYLSWDKYEAVNDNGDVLPIIAWFPGVTIPNPCYQNGDYVFRKARIVIEDCSGSTSQSGSDPANWLVGGFVPGYTDLVDIPMGNGSIHYIPKLQRVSKDVHEYNNPDKNIFGEIINDEEAKIPMGNDSGRERLEDEEGNLIGYNRRLLYVTKDGRDATVTQSGDTTIYEYGKYTGTTEAEKNELIPFVELDPIPPINPDDCEAIVFDGIWANGRLNLISETPGWHIKLKDEYIDDAFANFDDFQKVLLNRDTKPMYKSKFYTPRETDRGVITHERSYVWPLMQGGWNLDFQSGAYESYLNGLLYIATYYDDLRSDNIWRSYTHESIKNFDWTTPRDTYVPEIDGDLIDTERMSCILRVAGRQFDDLKRYIENIKFTVNVSYDSRNNMPDKAMAKFLEMMGWEVKNVSPINDNSLIEVEDYPGMNVKTRPEEANTEFLKRMILNSRNILSKKGTRAGIEAMYSMFGIFDMKYKETYSGIPIGFEIFEYDALVNSYIVNDGNGLQETPYEKVVNMNSEKDGYASQFERTTDLFCGLMVANKFILDNVEYLVPWYDIDELYDGNAYYQMYGGWGKRERKKVMVSFAPNIAEIVSDDDFSIYDETVKVIKVVENFTELNKTPIGFLNEGDIFYVLNIFDGYPNGGCEESNDSHYVFLTGDTSDWSGTIVSYNDNYSWCVVNNGEFTGSTVNTWYAKKIIYLESLHDNSVGNNPHYGKVPYDDGKEYFEYYKKLFKGAYDEDLFVGYRERINTQNARIHYDNKFRVAKLDDLTDNSQDPSYGLANIGFDLQDELFVDNSKVWYFLLYDNGLYSSTPSLYTGSMVGKRAFGSTDSFADNEIGIDDFQLVSESVDNAFNRPICNDCPDTTIQFKKEETLDIPETVRNYQGEGPDEVWSYAVINTKNVKIVYHLPWEMEDYVTNIVEFYVKQLIPSTVITEFVWNPDGEFGPRPAAKAPITRLSLSPSFQRIRSFETEAEIDMNSVNVQGIDLNEHTTIR